MTESRRMHRGLQRDHDAETSGRVSNIELFFDLVFVFAVTRLSHTLLDNLTPLGALQTGVLFLGVWWIWIYTSWVTNFLDPEKIPVRLAVLALMLVGLVLSTSIPEAFGDRGLVFAIAYVTMQVGRTFFIIWALGDDNPGLRRNFQRIAVWLIAAALFWIAGGLAEGNTRLILWLIALGIEYVSPLVGMWVPGWGRSETSEWAIEGSHFAERCSLFIIIALGESILITGATVADLPFDELSVEAFLTAFVGSVALWWLYFDQGAALAAHRIETSTDPGRIARIVYTYIHVLLVLGIILAAAADELLLEHVDGHLEPAIALVMISAGAVYLLGNLLFKWVGAGYLAASHVVGIVATLALLPFISRLTPVTLSMATTLILVIVAIWESITVRGRLAVLHARAVHAHPDAPDHDETPDIQP